MCGRLRAVLVAAVALTAATGLSACMDAGAASPGGGARTVVIDIKHSRFSVSAIDVRAGETVRFVVHNADPIGHELIIGDQAVQEHHEQGTEAHHGERPGEVSVEHGATAETIYTFIAPGRLLFGCHLPGHWAFGMQGVIRVA